MPSNPDPAHQRITKYLSSGFNSSGKAFFETPRTFYPYADVVPAETPDQVKRRFYAKSLALIEAHTLAPSAITEIHDFDVVRPARITIHREAQFERSQIKISEVVTDMLRDTTPMWEDLTYDSFLFHAATEHVQRKHPRVVFLGFGETDKWAHAGRYDLYLTAAHHVDDFVRRLWITTQNMRQYRDKTTFILTADHGRGSGPKAWRDHGEKVEGAERDWIVIIGPDTPPLGERTGVAPISAPRPEFVFTPILVLIALPLARIRTQIFRE